MQRESSKTNPESKLPRKDVEAALKEALDAKILDQDTVRDFYTVWELHRQFHFDNEYSKEEEVVEEEEEE